MNDFIAYLAHMRRGAIVGTRAFLALMLHRHPQRRCGTPYMRQSKPRED